MSQPSAIDGAASAAKAARPPTMADAVKDIQEKTPAPAAAAIATDDGASPPAATAGAESAAPGLDENLLDVLATKIMGAWLSNRQQLMVPLTLDLQKLEPGHAETLLHTMVAAAQADGTLDEADRTRLDGALKFVNASEAQRAQLDAAFERPRCLAEVLGDVRDRPKGATVYAAALLAIDRRTRVNRAFLRYLAERLQLPNDTRTSLEQRFTSTG